MSLSNSIKGLFAYKWLAFFIIVGCTPAATPTTSSSGYEEDISVHRTKYPDPDYSFMEEKQASNIKVEKPDVEPTNHIKAELDTVLYRIKKSRENIGYIDGLTIQVYSGNNRDKANAAKRKVYSVSKDFSPKVLYDQPNYKVNVGDYYTRLEAHKHYSMLKKQFEQALLVPKRIPIEISD